MKNGHGPFLFGIACQLVNLECGTFVGKDLAIRIALRITLLMLSTELVVQIAFQISGEYSNMRSECHATTDLSDSS